MFHEECLFKWIRTGQLTCPQCRCKLKEKEIVKRLYLTEFDITASQTSSDFRSIEVNQENYERLLNKVEELKQSMKEQTDALQAKSKLIEQSEKKIKENEMQLVNTRKNLSERQLLIDYLKKELENYSKIKDQNDARLRKIDELELKLREFRSVEMIYKEHESLFANEMNKYLTQATNPHLSQTIIRQLVNTNVLLKEHSDKQMEEKRLLRKKLIQIERTNSDQTKQNQKQENEITELRSLNEKLRYESKLKETEIKNLKNNFQSTPSLNKENILTNSNARNSSLIVDDTIDYEEADQSTENKSADFSMKKSANNNDDSDLKYLDELNKLDCAGNRSRRPDVITLDDDRDSFNDTPSPLAKKRKNPFVAAQNDFDTDEIRPNQAQNKLKIQKFKSFNELSLTVRDSPIEIVKPIVSNMKRSRFDPASTSSGSGVGSVKSNQQQLQQQKHQQPSIHKAFSYLSDGLGGRSKITNSSGSSGSSSLTSAANASKSSNSNLVNFAKQQFGKKQNFLTKSKVSNFK